MSVDRVKPRGPDATEAELQATIVGGLRRLGYTVLITGAGRARVRCISCGSMFYPRGWQGNTPGTPDLLVRHPSWQGWQALELKTSHGRIRPEQRVLADAGMTHIVRSWEDAMVAVGMSV